MLNDEPVRAPAVDLLGTGQRAAQLSALILRSSGVTPFTIAVDADWGMGKSSLMHRVRSDLEAQPGVECVWFNAWTSHGDDALEALIKSVLERFDRSALRRTARRVGRHQRPLLALRGVARALLDLVRLGSAVDDVWAAFAGDAKSRNDLRQVIKDLAADWAARPVPETGGRRMLVVFVDDLDRCADETVQAVCEAVKVYLDVPGLVFVLGCDQARLASAGRAEGGGYGAVDYLEKIIQSSYRIPAPTAEEARNLVLAYTEDSRTQTVISGRLPEVLAERTGRNPRRIKRLINSFVLEYHLAPQWWEFGPEALIHIVLLQHLYPDFYRAAARPGGRDMVADFLGYRQARSMLRLGRAGSEPEEVGEQPDNVDALFTELDLVTPSDVHPEVWPERLSDLEAALPPVFTGLAADDDFVTLLSDVQAMPEAKQLWQHVRRTGVSPTANAPEPGPVFPRGTASPYAVRRCPNGHTGNEPDDEWCRTCGFRLEPRPAAAGGGAPPTPAFDPEPDTQDPDSTGTFPVPLQPAASPYSYPTRSSPAPPQQKKS
nr:P-loop NTPase fold protein [Streptomyces coryli]